MPKEKIRLNQNKVILNFTKYVILFRLGYVQYKRLRPVLFNLQLTFIQNAYVTSEH
jgi:hypothetical protein